MGYKRFGPEVFVNLEDGSMKFRLVPIPSIDEDSVKPDNDDSLPKAKYSDKMLKYLPNERLATPIEKLDYLLKLSRK